MKKVLTYHDEKKWDWDAIVTCVSVGGFVVMFVGIMILAFFLQHDYYKWLVSW